MYSVYLTNTPEWTTIPVINLHRILQNWGLPPHYRDCLTKTKAYVAIHHSIGLAFSIVRQPSKIIFIKGTVSKLHINFSVFTAHLSLKVQGSFKVLSLAWYLERGRFPSKACSDFAVHHSFKGKCLINWYPDISGCVLCTLKRLPGMHGKKLRFEQVLCPNIPMI